VDATLAAYLGRTAWPELICHRPAVVYPAPPGPTALPVLAHDGWSGLHEPEGWTLPVPGWKGVLDPHRQHLTVTRPGGLPWFTGLLPATREWRRAARNAGAVLQITGPFAGPAEFPAAASAGLLRLCVVPLTLAGDTW
jgi:hypothetical protein